MDATRRCARVDSWQSGMSKAATTPGAEVVVGVREAVRERLLVDAASERTTHIVLAALDGQSELDALLGAGVVPSALLSPAEQPEPRGAYITSVSVEGFRGVGERATLELNPGPGLTLVIGRNGSGKSSFAEALEVLFTGDSPRWAKRSAVWREGWRNLHHPRTAIQSTLAVERLPAQQRRAVYGAMERRWSRARSKCNRTVCRRPTSRSSSGTRRWPRTGRSFPTTLGAMIEEGPTRLHGAVSSVLGLDELPAAEKVLKDARLARERIAKEVLAERDEICAVLEKIDDERAGPCVAVLRGKRPNLDALESILEAPAATSADGELATLQAVVAYRFPTADTVAAAANELHEAQVELARARWDAVRPAAPARRTSGPRRLVPRDVRGARLSGMRNDRRSNARVGDGGRCGRRHEPSGCERSPANEDAYGCRAPLLALRAPGAEHVSARARGSFACRRSRRRSRRARLPTSGTR